MINLSIFYKILPEITSSQKATVRKINTVLVQALYWNKSTISSNLHDQNSAQAQIGWHQTIQPLYRISRFIRKLYSWRCFAKFSKFYSAFTDRLRGPKAPQSPKLICIATPDQDCVPIRKRDECVAAAGRHGAGAGCISDQHRCERAWFTC